jgi:hypothetical protein
MQLILASILPIMLALTCGYGIGLLLPAAIPGTAPGC